ncbi:MAG: hypothetical protein CEN89_383 [Candidatus Berkelbacteria bacterium Licking1014_7]|uniref:Glycosyltransferase RgtA/B/C/D-like domain-containing protein n=1 Tax=Candidatus Berkelbacteria bacterium Licking1014_7 TaxID=2017147 RepID=A0A554LJ09_9BACT|nr:MAG: hypothetical protein CEN89_383 [Candidatus Berkelbacteria bacterium Licking1014_7]
MAKMIIKKWWKNNLFIISFLTASFIFLLVINNWFWPTPDEYLYASVARSIIAGIKGEICLSCFNTEHTYLVSAMVAIYQWLLGLGDIELIASRIPIIFFSLGTIYILWLISGKIIEKKEERSWFLWLLLLIPGYFVLSVRFLLDVPLTFGFALLIYLLIIRARAIWIGLGLALILLIKDYGFFLAAPLIIISFILDAFEARQSTILKNIVNFVIQILIVFLPSFFVIVIFLAFNFLPYPRLLETGLIEYLGDGYIVFVKVISWLTSKIAPFINPSDGISYAQALVQKARQLEFSGKFPTTIFDSPLTPEISAGFFKKIWLIYQYNFSEQDVMIFAWPLFFTGLILRIKAIIKSGKAWLSKRNDILFLVLVLIFFYVNWHEALNIHGFRLTVPITLALVYFSYCGLKEILAGGNHKARIIFIFSSVIFLSLYMAFVFQIREYGSLISAQSMVGWLLHYKLLIFLILFSSGFLFLWLYPILSWKRKKLLLLIGLLFFFVLKFFPFYLESKAANKQYDFDYGLPEAVPYLEQIKQQDVNIAANANPYMMDYYAKTLNLPNEGSAPVMRDLKRFNRYIFYWYRSTYPRLDISFLVAHKINYIFFVNREIGDQSYQE